MLQTKKSLGRAVHHQPVSGFEYLDYDIASACPGATLLEYIVVVSVFQEHSL